MPITHHHWVQIYIRVIVIGIWIREWYGEIWLYNRKWYRQRFRWLLNCRRPMLAWAQYIYAVVITMVSAGATVTNHYWLQF